MVTTGSVDTATPGAYILTYTATDVAGNEATVSRTVNVNSPKAVFSVFVDGKVDSTWDEGDECGGLRHKLGFLQQWRK